MSIDNCARCNKPSIGCGIPFFGPYKHKPLCYNCELSLQDSRIYRLKQKIDYYEDRFEWVIVFLFYPFFRYYKNHKKQ